MRNLFLVCVFCMPAFAVAQNTAYKVKAAKQAEAINQKVINWRRDFHQNPELGNREFRTADIIVKHLQSLGLTVVSGIAKTGVVAVLKGGKPGPVVALRADMDALPVTEGLDLPFASKVKTTYNGVEVGVMHACGHDAHVAILMGVAEVLAGMKNDLAGSVKFIFQPAEEGAPVGEEGGAELMVKEGVLNNPKVDVIFGLHIDAGISLGQMEYKTGGIMAGVNDMKITVKGKQVHGAYPWLGADPIVASAQIVNSLQTVVSRNLDVTRNPGVVTIGSINGGVRSNIIPDKVEMLGTLRNFSQDDEQLFIKRVKTIVTKTAEAAGVTAKVEIPYSSRYPVTFNDVALTEKMVPTLQYTFGKENTLLTTPVTGAEDFAFYQEKVPGMFFFLGARPKEQRKEDAAAHHTPTFFIHEDSFVLGVKALCNLTLDYMALKK